MYVVLFMTLIVLSLDFCDSYTIFRNKIISLRTKMLINNEISSFIICYSEDFKLEIVKAIAPAVIPIASAALFFKFADDSVKAKFDSIKESTKAQVASIEKQITNTEKLIIAIEKKIESDKQAIEKKIEVDKQAIEIKIEADKQAN